MKMGRMMMYRDEYDKQEMLEYAHEIKKAACKLIEALDDGEQMSERGRYRDNTRRMRMRDDWDDSRDSRYGY